MSQYQRPQAEQPPAHGLPGQKRLWTSGWCRVSAVGRVLCGIPGAGLTSEGQEHWGGGPGAVGVHGDGDPLLPLLFWEESAGGPAIAPCSGRGLSGPQDDPPRLGVVVPSFTDKEMRPRVPGSHSLGRPNWGQTRACGLQAHTLGHQRLDEVALCAPFPSALASGSGP